MTERHGMIAAAILALLLCGLCVFLTVRTADAAWPTLRGPASVFGNDPSIGFTDYEDNCITATGTSCTSGGIAVMRRSTLGGWWRVCAPRKILRRGVRRCHLIKQSELGPAPWAGRVVDVSAVTARRAWRINAFAFPTDVGIWTLRYRGKHKSGRHR